MKLDALIKNLPGLVYRCKNDKNWTTEFISDGCFALTGYHSADFMNNRIQLGEIILKKDYKLVWQKTQKAIANKTSYNLEYRIKHKNGSIKYFWEQGQAIFDNNDCVIALEGFVQDISKQKETEQKLLIKQVQKKAILETLPDIVILYDKNGNHLEVHAPNNFEIAALYEHNIGKNIDAVFPEEVCKMIKKAFVNCEETKDIQILEYALVIDDKLRHLESRIVPTDNGNYLTVIRDVTKIKQTDKIIKENEERLRLSLEVGELGSWEWNLVTNKILRDDYQNLLFGIKSTDTKAAKSSITFQSFLENVHPEDREYLKSEISEAVKNASSYVVDYRIIHPDNSIHWLHEKGKIFKNTKGQPLRVIGVTHDITAQKIAEQKLKDDEEALRDYTEKLENKVKERTKELTTTVQKLVESNLSLEDQIQITKSAEKEVVQNKYLLDNISQNFPKGFVAVFDVDFKILLVEGEEVEELGFKGLADSNTLLDHVIGVPDDVKQTIRNNIVKTFKGEHCSFEIEYQNRTFLVNTTPLYNSENKIEQVLLVHNNITLQKKAEFEILNTLKKEQELSELKSRFISMASHEFRTPLSAILSSAILIEKLNKPGNEEKRLNHVSKIRSNVKDLVLILNDFLSLSKLQEGKVLVQPSSFDLINFSKSVIEEIEGIKKDGQIISLIHQQPKIDIYLDSKLLKHILFNLVSNAIKYSEENKAITFKIQATEQHVVIEITDQGIGIPKEDLDSMFQRFYRANNTTNIQGTGLGLNIVKQYTELMGGSITFKSELNVGSTFFIEFPLNIEK